MKVTKKLAEGIPPDVLPGQGLLNQQGFVGVVFFCERTNLPLKTTGL